MRTSVTCTAAALVFCLTGSPARAQPRDATACAALGKLQMPGVALSEVKATWFAAGAPPPQNPFGPPLTAKFPAYCRFDATLDKRTGAEGKTYGIGFAIGLPAEWNGRFLFQGGGGLNGTVMPPVGATAAGSIPGLVRGFAVVSTDTGHKGQVFDASFMRDQQASLDFAYQAVGRVAVLAKQIVAQYYGKAPERSYFSGCSTGGREGMLMAQRYPGYFDGIIVGAPAMRTNYSGIGDEWVATMLNQVAPKDANGKPLPAQALSDANRKAVIDGLLNACDAGDGLKDGMIFNASGCAFSPRALVCNAGRPEGCLNNAQAEAIEKAFAGPKDSKGRQVYPGFLYDTGLTNTQGIPGLLAGSMNPVGPPFTKTEMDVDARAEAAAAEAGMVLTITPSWVNLNTFSGHGGKLAFYHGVSDPWFSALDTVDYYTRMTDANGGAAEVSKWSRLFLVPGMGHCGGGSAALDTFDLLSAVIEWVEKETPPASVAATGRAFPGRSRPLCPYPQHAHYKGTGSVEDSASFECRP